MDDRRKIIVSTFCKFLNCSSKTNGVKFSNVFNSVCGIIINFFFNKSLDSLDCKLFVKCLFIY